VTRIDWKDPVNRAKLRKAQEFDRESRYHFLPPYEPHTIVEDDDPVLVEARILSRRAE
jgi:hypothetical protein